MIGRKPTFNFVFSRGRLSCAIALRVETEQRRQRAEDVAAADGFEECPPQHRFGEKTMHQAVFNCAPTADSRRRELSEWSPQLHRPPGRMTMRCFRHHKLPSAQLPVGEPTAAAAAGTSAETRRSGCGNAKNAPSRMATVARAVPNRACMRPTPGRSDLSAGAQPASRPEECGDV